MKNYILLLTIFLASHISYAQQEVEKFSLQEAIDYALEYNRTVKNAARDIEIARQQKWETTAIGLPQLNANVDYQNWIEQQVSLLPAAAFDNTQSTIDIVNDYFDATQTNFDVNVPEGFIPVRFGTKQNINATATLTQILFDGSYLVGLQSVKVFLQIAENAKEKTDLEIRLGVINAYGNVLLAEETVSILNRNIAVIEKNLTEVTRIYENGLEEEESVEQLQITLSSLESALSNAERLNTLAYQMFNITLGIDVNTTTVLTDSLEILAIENIELDLLAEEENIENNVDYKIANNDKLSKEILLKYEKSKYLPSLTAFINGGYLGNSDTFTFANRDQQWFGSSLLGISLNVPIFSSGMRSAQKQRAAIEFEKATDNLTETEQQLKFQIATAKSNYQFAIEEYQNKKENLNLAERIEQKNQTKFFEGIASSFDLRQAQTQLYSSQQDLLQAMLNVITRKAELETVLNTVSN